MTELEVDKQYIEDTIFKGNTVFWTKVVPNCDVFEVIALKVHDVRDTYFTCTEERSMRTYLFGYTTLENTVFKYAPDADEKLADVRVTYYETHKKVSHQKDTNDYE